MKKLTQISLILFITALSFSSCEEDEVLRETVLNDDGSEVINSQGSIGEESNNDKADSYDERPKVGKEDR